MLSVVGGGQNLECTKFLLSHHAALTLTDPVGNSILHLAALHSNRLALDFLLEHWFKTAPLDLGSRNKKGDTLFSIASAANDKETQKIL
jgi:ankyrin repeat protein